MHRSPIANGLNVGGVNAKVPGDNRQRIISSSTSNSNMCNTNTQVVGSNVTAGGFSGAGNVDAALMQEHFSNSAKKVKEKLMLDEMHELLEEPVEEQVGNVSNYIYVVI